MKKIIFGLMLLSALAMTTSVLAAPGRGMGGWGAGTEYGRMYNTQTVETVTGEVVKVKKIKPMRGMSYGIHLILKTDNGEIPVHLGPAWYINNQDMEVAVGDKVEVKGSRVTYDDKPAIIAAEVKKGDDTLKLRDDNGFPAWAGWRRNQ
jgi:hypothetical protein